MGVSTDAMIVYGVPIEEEEMENLREQLTEDEWDDLIDLKWQDEHNFGLISHCSDEYPMYFVGYELLRASRGFPEIIPEFFNDELSDWRIKEFCDKYSLSSQTPELYLASDWG